MLYHIIDQVRDTCAILYHIIDQVIDTFAMLCGDVLGEYYVCFQAEINEIMKDYPYDWNVSQHVDGVE